jgi:hypothetical protein
MCDPAVSGQSDLVLLLKTIRPVIGTHPFIIHSISQDEFARLGFLPLCAFRETEGVTVIVTQAQAKAQQWPPDPAWACITLTVHSSLQAVGFLAAITGALAREGISVNPVSAFYHDHLFVPWERRQDAMDTLQVLSRSPDKGKDPS